MAVCSSCSAPLKRVICEYCGTRNDIDLSHISVFSDTTPNESRYCPICVVPLVTTNLSIDSKMYVERCGRCFGLFFDKGELQAILELSVEHKSRVIDFKRLNEILEKPYHRDSVEYRTCPVCRKLMQRKNYLKRSGVIIDRCDEHGIWLDSGELKQIMEFIRLGGATLSDEYESSLNEKYSVKDEIPKYNLKDTSYTKVSEQNLKDEYPSKNSSDGYSFSDAFFDTMYDISDLFR